MGSLSLALLFSGCAAVAIGLPIAWDVATTTIGILQRQTANESLQAANDQLRRTVQALEQIRLALDPEFRTERAKLERRKTEWLVEAVEKPEATPPADQLLGPADQLLGPMVVRLEHAP